MRELQINRKVQCTVNPVTDPNAQMSAKEVENRTFSYTRTIIHTSPIKGCMVMLYGLHGILCGVSFSPGDTELNLENRSI